MVTTQKSRESTIFTVLPILRGLFNNYALPLISRRTKITIISFHLLTSKIKHPLAQIAIFTLCRILHNLQSKRMFSVQFILTVLAPFQRLHSNFVTYFFDKKSRSKFPLGSFTTTGLSSLHFKSTFSFLHIACMSCFI